jgi:type II secretory pathway component PulK
MRKINQKGVALMLVLSAIAVLTTMIVEFSYNTNINYHLAMNERDRLKAYYLAKSALSFMLLELKFDKQFKGLIESQNLGQYLGETANLPLCQQFPLSTGLIRTIFVGGVLSPESMGGETGSEGDGGDVDDEIEDLRRDVSVSQEKSAMDFLEFDGDFDGECVDEGIKINLNGFAGLGETVPSGADLSELDQYKMFVYNFLKKSEFELLFEKAEVNPVDVVDNIADWIDANVEVNRVGGRGGGAERSPYDKLGVPYTVRNGKLVTLFEAYMIDGVVDAWFGPIEHYFTIYGDGKINPCISSREIIEGLIARYVASNSELTPIRAGDTEQMDRLVNAVLEGCSLGGSGDQFALNIQSSLDTAMGLDESGTGAGGRSGSTPPPISRFINQGAKFFTLKLAGQIMDTTVRIQTVIDVGQSDPSKWKFLYWRIY